MGMLILTLVYNIIKIIRIIIKEAFMKNLHIILQCLVCGENIDTDKSVDCKCLKQNNHKDYGNY